MLPRPIPAIEKLRVKLKHRVAMVPDFRLFGGAHCETAALSKIFRFHGLNYDEELLFGLGGGIGFVFWQSKRMPIPFVGGRNGKFPEFISRICQNTGQPVEVMRTTSARTAHEHLMTELSQARPVICYGDIHYLPYFQVRRHFGGHAFVVYGVDEPGDKVFISDRGGSTRVVCLDALLQARASPASPFPPKHAWLNIDVRDSSPPSREVVVEAIRSCCESMRYPPIANLGLRGLSKLATEMRKWLVRLDDALLFDYLTETYVNLELAGTGGCAFRRMYRAFLQRVAPLVDHSALTRAMPLLDRVLELWSAFLERLLPDEISALGRARECLRAKNRLFETGTNQELTDRSGFDSDFAGFRKAAIGELKHHKKHLTELPVAIEDIRFAESELIDMLGLL